MENERGWAAAEAARARRRTAMRRAGLIA